MIPSEKELITFIKIRDFVNYSTIAKFYEINNATVSDLINDLVEKKLVIVKKFGGSKLIKLKWKDKSLFMLY